MYSQLGQKVSQIEIENQSLKQDLLMLKQEIATLRSEISAIKMKTDRLDYTGGKLYPWRQR